MSYQLNEPMPGTLDPPRIAARMGRFFGALLADLKLVDSGSLDVLVYCGDDVAAGGLGDWKLAESLDAP